MFASYIKNKNYKEENESLGTYCNPAADTFVGDC